MRICTDEDGCTSKLEELLDIIRWLGGYDKDVPEPT